MYNPKMKRGQLRAIILELLMNYPNLRDDDNALEVQVCRWWHYCFDSMSAADFIQKRDEMGFPSRESIGRIRRLIQTEIEELGASPKCHRKRTKLAKEWKEYCTK